MHPLNAIFLYVCIWFVVIFMVLPWGLEMEKNPQIGHADSAPKNARIPLKLLITSLISLGLLGVSYYISTLKLFDLRVL